MRLLTDENVPRSVVGTLRDLGHDVSSVTEDMQGATDLMVLDRAVAESRVLVTQDKDFGELVFRTQRNGIFGVILFRSTELGRSAFVERMVATIDGRDDWIGSFAVVDDRRIRIRTIPGAK